MASTAPAGAVTALIVLDAQRDFLSSEHGALPVLDGDSLVPQLNDLLSLVRRSPATENTGVRGTFEHVVFTQDWHPSNHVSFASQHPDVVPLTTITLPRWEQLVVPDHCVAHSDGACFHEALLLHPERETGSASVHVVRKGSDAAIESHSAFRDIVGASTGLKELLDRLHVSRIVLCGVHIDVLLLKTVLDAVREYPEPGAVRVVRDATRGFVPSRFDESWQQIEAAGALLVTTHDLQL